MPGALLSLIVLLSTRRRRTIAVPERDEAGTGAARYRGATNAIFGGRYLSFVRSDDGDWLLRLSNPVSGDEFIGPTSLRPRED